MSVDPSNSNNWVFVYCFSCVLYDLLILYNLLITVTHLCDCLYVFRGSDNRCNKHGCSCIMVWLSAYGSQGREHINVLTWKYDVHLPVMLISVVEVIFKCILVLVSC